MRASTYCNDLAFAQCSLGLVVSLSVWTRLPDLAQVLREKCATSSASGFYLSRMPHYLVGTCFLVWLNLDCQNTYWWRGILELRLRVL